MRQESKEALALELTKAVINERSKNESAFDITDPGLWIYEYTEALKKINEAYEEQSADQALDIWPKLNP
ncbi:hypothetical protein [Acinetobacter sp. Leaf130]|uniref:hypothetical protein n=1 Tax=Acinetobacter sp. Leaf130 TaxID=1736269 RepID=UPI0006FA4433|nr:hypothetical protein [Acinetobacter sp. Leaf130]KQQ77265.1 hypothetical protein ASF86_07100 [Acinetobacter sp. Leaf130]